MIEPLEHCLPTSFTKFIFFINMALIWFQYLSSKFIHNFAAVYSTMDMYDTYNA